MKTLKNLFPLFALIFGLALVFTQSAFTSASKANAKETDLFWYEIQNEQTVGEPVHFGTKTSAFNYTICEDEPEQDVCLLGSATELEEGTPVGDPDEDYRILKNEE